MGRTIIIGDIHGCFDELTDLLELLKLRADDRVVAVGDLIVKGEKSREVLDLRLRSLAGATAEAYAAGDWSRHRLRIRWPFDCFHCGVKSTSECSIPARVHGAQD